MRAHQSYFIWFYYTRAYFHQQQQQNCKMDKCIQTHNKWFANYLITHTHTWNVLIITWSWHRKALWAEIERCLQSELFVFEDVWIFFLLFLSLSLSLIRYCYISHGSIVIINIKRVNEIDWREEARMRREQKTEN